MYNETINISSYILKLTSNKISNTEFINLFCSQIYSDYNNLHLFTFIILFSYFTLLWINKYFRKYVYITYFRFEFPIYKELPKELKTLGCIEIEDFSIIKWIADILLIALFIRQLSFFWLWSHI